MSGLRCLPGWCVAASSPRAVVLAGGSGWAGRAGGTGVLLSPHLHGWVLSGTGTAAGQAWGRWDAGAEGHGAAWLCDLFPACHHFPAVVWRGGRQRRGTARPWSDPHLGTAGEARRTKQALGFSLLIQLCEMSLLICLPGQRGGGGQHFSLLSSSERAAAQVSARGRCVL